MINKGREREKQAIESLMCSLAYISNEKHKHTKQFSHITHMEDDDVISS